jgi:hypothetical protein
MSEPLHPRHKVLAELAARIAQAKINRDRCLQDLAVSPGTRRAKVMLRQAEERLVQLRRSQEALLDDAR